MGCTEADPLTLDIVNLPEPREQIPFLSLVCRLPRDGLATLTSAFVPIVISLIVKRSPPVQSDIHPYCVRTKLCRPKGAIFTIARQ